MKYTIICYRQYDEWYSTKPWVSRKEAEKHADRWLRDPSRDYINNITFIEVELPK